MAVDVEDRDEDQHLLVQRALGQAAIEHLAQRQEAGVLAVDFAGVDAALDQRHRQAGPGGGLRRERAGAGGDERQHRAVFRRAAEFDAFDCFRIRLFKGGAQLDDLVVAAGGLEAGALGDRAQVVGGGGRVGKGRGGEQRKQ